MIPKHSSAATSVRYALHYGASRPNATIKVAADPDLFLRLFRGLLPGCYPSTADAGRARRGEEAFVGGMVVLKVRDAIKRIELDRWRLTRTRGSHRQ